LPHSSQRHQLRGAEMFADFRSLSETRGGGAKITLEQEADGGRVKQISPFNAVQVAVINQLLPPVDPTAAAGELALVQEPRRPAKRPPRRPPDVADPQGFLMRTPPDINGLLVPADEIGGRPEQLQILKVEPGLTIRRR
jgi:hypothetical protein